MHIRINKEDRDALRIFWYENLDSRFIKEFRFTRPTFGAGSSPYILNATIEKHVSAYNVMYPKTVKALLNDTYVDDIQGGGNCIKDLETFKIETEIIMKQGGFALHKWHSNVTSRELISNEIVNNSHGKLSPASRTNERILGVPWNKERDTLRTEFTPCMQVKEPITKRKILSAAKRWMGSLNTRRHTEKMGCMGKDVFRNEFFNCSMLRYNSTLSATLLTWIR